MKVAWPVLRRWALAAVAVGAWAWVAESRLLPRAFVPSPVEVARGFVEVLGNGLLIRHVKDSVLRFAACYALGSGAGVVAGVLMGLVPPRPNCAGTRYRGLPPVVPTHRFPRLPSGRHKRATVHVQAHPGHVTTLVAAQK
jgi:hypothetical protein